MQINVTFDPAVAVAPTGFEATVIRAAHDLGASFNNTATLSIDIGWGENNGTMLPAGVLANGGSTIGDSVSYETLVADLRALPQDAASQVFLHNLPTVDPSNSATGYFVPDAQGRLFGIPQGNPFADGTLGFSTGVTWNTTTGPSPPGSFDLYDITQHEITHALGRYAVPVQPAPGDFFRTLFDLTNFSNGVIDVSGGPGFRDFSINGGKTILGHLDGPNDAGDWANGNPPDALNAFATDGQMPFSPLDSLVMDVIGYMPVSTTYDAWFSTANWTINLNQHSASSSDVGNVTVGASFQNVTGGSGNDVLAGNSGNNVLIGGAGNDTLNGNIGADTMIGGLGNDAYVVDNAADVVTEASGGGTDTIFATSSYTLAAGSEVEIMRANVATGLTLTGNAFSHAIIGNVGNDTLNGGPGNDAFNGNAGNDVIHGGAGNDSLNGGVGADTMSGGIGNDTYTVDNAADVVTETVGQGTDTVMASVNYTLAAGTEVEALRANATTGLKLTGNASSHILVGNIGNDMLLGGSGDDQLNGGGGADTMAGGGGNDTYFVDNAGDVLNEAVGQGTDTVYASANYSLSAGQDIEFLRANAGPTGLSLTGNEFANRLVGGTGNDTLDGGAGNDSLAGGAGHDIFKFLAGFGQDTITDFTAHAGAAGNKDLLDISSLGITAGTFAASVKITAGAGGTTMVSFNGSTNSIRLLNEAPASINSTDFKLA
jgi:Ca2+-binding RTX toxin-like protein